MASAALQGDILAVHVGVVEQLRPLGRNPRGRAHVAFAGHDAKNAAEPAQAQRVDRVWQWPRLYRQRRTLYKNGDNPATFPKCW